MIRDSDALNTDRVQVERVNLKEYLINQKYEQSMKKEITKEAEL